VIILCCKVYASKVQKKRAAGQRPRPPRLRRYSVKEMW